MSFPAYIFGKVKRKDFVRHFTLKWVNLGKFGR